MSLCIPPGKQAPADTPGGLLLPREPSAVEGREWCWWVLGSWAGGSTQCSCRQSCVFMGCPSTEATAVPPSSCSPFCITSHCLSLFCPVAEVVHKPFSFEQHQLNTEADFLHIDVVSPSLLAVSGSSQANSLRAYFIATCDSKERKYANTFPAQEEKHQV